MGINIIDVYKLNKQEHWIKDIEACNSLTELEYTANRIGLHTEVYDKIYNSVIDNLSLVKIDKSSDLFIDIFLRVAKFLIVDYVVLYNKRYILPDDWGPND